MGATGDGEREHENKAGGERGGEEAVEVGKAGGTRGKVGNKAQGDQWTREQEKS